MRFFTGLIHWTLMFTILFPAHVFAANDNLFIAANDNLSLIDQIIQIQNDQKEAADRLAQEVVIRKIKAQKQLKEINGWSEQYQRNSYEMLAARFLDNLEWLGKENTPNYRKKVNADPVEKEKRLSEIAETMALMTWSRNEALSIETRVESSKKKIELYSSERSKNYKHGFGFASLTAFLSGFPLYYFIKESEYTLNFHSAIQTIVPFLLIVISGQFAHFKFGLTSRNKMFKLQEEITLHSSKRELANASKQEAVREEFFWNKIHQALPILTRDTQDRISQLEKIIARKSNNPEWIAAENAVEKVRLAMQGSPCENLVTVGTDETKAIEAAKSSLETRMDEEFQAEKEAEEIQAPTKKVL